VPRATDRQDAGDDEALVERAHDVAVGAERTKKVPMIEVRMQTPPRWRADSIIMRFPGARSSAGEEDRGQTMVATTVTA
jgi:hypothetical protein